MLRLLNKLKIDFSVTWEMALFHLLWAVVLLANISWNTYLIGWDALNPEFDTFLNLQRSLFAGWQENYGAGTLGGHGFAATLPHTVAAGLLDLILPEQLVRQVFTLLTMYLGSLGVIILSKKIFSTYFSTLAGSRYISVIALAAGLFYAFNLGSTQIFYLPLEAFSIQFAALPWLYYFLLKFIEARNWKTALHFFLASFAASTQGFIPSLFVAYVFGLIVFFVALFFFSANKKHTLLTAFLALLITFLANSYWMGPFAYYVVNRNSVFLESYNNITSTSEFVEKNQLYGGISQVALLKSFFLETVYNSELIFKPWLNWYSSILISFVASVFFIITIFGAVVSFGKNQPPALKALAVTFIFYITALTTHTPPFSWFTNLLYVLSPTLEQAFRTPFTKFGIGLSFFYSFFFAIGIFFLIRVLMRTFLNYSTTVGKWTAYGIVALVILLGMPHLTGNTFYKGLKVAIPDSYFEVMDYFRDQPNGRIADLPVDCHEGWYTYSWGYIGSGFYWYGIQQPIMARSFDVWSSETESYYWELSTALRQNDFFMAEEILKKYGVTWILWDDNLQHCQSGDGFIYQRSFLDYLQSENSQFALDQTFATENLGSIQVFERKEELPGFVEAAINPVSIESNENYLDRDQALNYIDSYVSSNSLENAIYFPFRSLLSTRTGLADDVQIQKKGDTELLISTELPFER
ncbi:MAG: hypothetical protein QG639_82, partial [Patescibacteria group bacterium]|nr:hypothetical protein [Patescibacteria group bacterium]